MRRLPTAREVAKHTEPGRYAVGHGLYLQISEWHTRSWIFRYQRNGVARHMGLGSCEYVSLAQARQRAYELRQQLILNNIDPLEAKRANRLASVLASTRDKTFQQCAIDYIAAHEDSWRGDRSRKQWIESLTNHVFPKIGMLPIANVNVAAVLSVLDPIARNIPETARRIRSRIALVLDWAAARELRAPDNPAKRPNLLPKHKRRVERFAAMPYTDMPVFMAKLRQRPELTARALEFAILTAARPGEALGARWSEIEGNVWLVPAGRMKGDREHRVPLSDRAVELLAGLRHNGEFCFPGRFNNGPFFAPDALIKLLRKMGCSATVHGFRSTFRDWAAETTTYPNHVLEQALAHAIGSGVEAAYRRGDLFDKRRRLMDDWARYCSAPARSSEVTTLRGRQ
jgi:integrase